MIDQVLRVYLYMGALHDELATALRSGTLTLDTWRTDMAPGTSIVDSDGAVREQQRHVWRTLFPGEPVP